MVRDNKCFHQSSRWEHNTPNGQLLTVNATCMINNLFFSGKKQTSGDYIVVASREYLQSDGGTGWPINNPHHGIMSFISNLRIESFKKTTDLEQYIKTIINEVISMNPEYAKEKEMENFHDLINIDKVDQDEQVVIQAFQDLANADQIPISIENRKLMYYSIYDIIHNRVENNKNIARSLTDRIKDLFRTLIELERKEKQSQSKNKQEEEKNNDDHNQITEQNNNNQIIEKKKPKKDQKTKKQQQQNPGKDHILTFFNYLKDQTIKERNLATIENFIKTNLTSKNINEEVKNLNHALKNINTQYKINLKPNHNNNTIQILDEKGNEVLADGAMYKGKCGQSSHHNINIKGKNLLKDKLSELIYNEFKYKNKIDDLIKDIDSYRS